MNFSDFPFIRLIHFESFRNLGTFPRYPDHKNLTVRLADIDIQTYNENLFVFLSHCWLRGWSGAKGWDGRPHPDDADQGKYNLCVEGIERVMINLAPKMKGCYLWVDYGCIDQDGDPAGELRMLDKIVQVCDCLFTPIIDENHASWEIKSNRGGWYEGYKSAAWREGPYAYLNRGWCRIEMFYGSNIPLLEDNEERRARMRAGLLHHRKEGRRPHILYGTKQKVTAYPPIVMQPLQNVFFKKYNPANGTVTVESDRVTIERLVSELLPYMKEVKEEYEGERNAAGQKHGYGKCTFADGDYYEGEWKEGRHHGHGKCLFSDGNMYDGQWYENQLQGQGTCIFADGSKYEGEWKQGIINGKGKHTFANGNIFDGTFKGSKKDGLGTMYYLDGTIFKVTFREDVMYGPSRKTFPNGDISEDMFENHRKHGICRYFTKQTQTVTVRVYDHGSLVSEVEEEAKETDFTERPDFFSLPVVPSPAPGKSSHTSPPLASLPAATTTSRPNSSTPSSSKAGKKHRFCLLS